MTQQQSKRPVSRHFDLPDGTTFQIVFGYEGVVYDLIGKDGEVDLEYGYDFYEDLLPKEYKHQSINP
jgi:hypothetical protein